VNVVELELYPSETELIDVALTRAQRVKAGQMLIDEEVIEREPRWQIRQDQIRLGKRRSHT
jgi:hypothetical protein